MNAWIMMIMKDSKDAILDPHIQKERDFKLNPKTTGMNKAAILRNPKDQVD